MSIFRDYFKSITEAVSGPAGVLLGAIVVGLAVVVFLRQRRHARPSFLTAMPPQEERLLLLQKAKEQRAEYEAMLQTKPPSPVASPVASQSRLEQILAAHRNETELWKVIEETYLIERLWPKWQQEERILLLLKIREQRAEYEALLRTEPPVIEQILAAKRIETELWKALDETYLISRLRPMWRRELSCTTAAVVIVVLNVIACWLIFGSPFV